MKAPDMLYNQVFRWPTDRSRKWARTFLESVSKDPNIVAVLAVGSAVRPRVQSVDFDVLVICKDPAKFRQVRPIEVDLRVYSADEIESQIEAGHDLLGWAVKFGHVLYQRNNFWTRIVQSWQDRLPLPSAKLARDRAASAYRRLSNVLNIGDLDAAHEQALSYLTHLARAELLDREIYPASRPELPQQLRLIGGSRVGQSLEQLLHREPKEISEIVGLIQGCRLMETR